MGWYIRGALIANVIIMGFMWLISYSEKADGGVSFQSTDEAFLIIGTFDRAVFIVFGAVLIVKLVISEYKNKTILVMFTYPISRKKLLTAKSGLLDFICCVYPVIVSGIRIVLFLHGDQECGQAGCVNKGAQYV